MKLYDYAGAFAEMFDSFDAICSYEPKSNELGEFVDDDGNVISDPDAYIEEQKETWFKMLVGIEEDFEIKAENIAAYIKSLNAEINDLKDEEKSLKSRRQVKERQSEWLKKYLLSNMQTIWRTKIDRPMAKLSIRNNAESAQFENERHFIRMCIEQGLDTYLRYQEPEINKTAVKKALQSGIRLKGAILGRTQSLTIK